MSQKTDKRTIRTINAIRDAFMALIIEVGFEHVTVQAVADRAGINRATFYRHYKDKFDLADRFNELLFTDMFKLVQQSGSIEDIDNWKVLFTHVGEHAEFYRAMLGEGSIPGFREFIRQTVERQMAAIAGMFDLDPPLDDLAQTAVIRYLASAQVGFVEWWLENDMPYSAEEAAVYLRTLHQQGGNWALGMPANV